MENQEAIASGRELERQRGKSKRRGARVVGFVPLPARSQRILSMVRADVKLPLCPRSQPGSLCCL